MTDPVDRQHFLNIAALFEGGLALAGFALGWLAGIDPLGTLRLEWTALMWGVAGALPVFALFLLSMRYPVGGLRGIRAFLLEYLGPYLDVCRWYDLLALAAIAGFSEEVLFRGVLQPWIGRWGPMTGLIGSNVVFGLAHMITPTYALIAGLMGLYLGVLPDASEPPNLLVPIITHALYDWLAFLVVVRAYRREGFKVETL